MSAKSDPTRSSIFLSSCFVPQFLHRRCWFFWPEGTVPWPPEKVWSELCFAKLLIIKGLFKSNSLLRYMQTCLKASRIFLNNWQSVVCKYFTRSKLLEKCHGTGWYNYSSRGGAITVVHLLCSRLLFLLSAMDGFQWTDLTVDTIWLTGNGMVQPDEGKWTNLPVIRCTFPSKILILPPFSPFFRGKVNHFAAN